MLSDSNMLTVLQLLQLVVLPLLLMVIRDVRNIGERVARIEGMLKAKEE
jgi:hypothetical protein